MQPVTVQYFHEHLKLKSLKRYGEQWQIRDIKKHQNGQLEANYSEMF